MAFEIFEICQTSPSGEMAATGGILKISKKMSRYMVFVYGFIWFYMVLYGFYMVYMVYLGKV